MALVPGPVLIFRGARDRSFDLSALLGVAAEDPPPPLEAGNERVPPRRLAGRRGCSLWRYDFSLRQGAGRSDYRIGRRRWRVHLPSGDGSLRIAFTACNGSEQGNAWESLQTRNERWLHLAAVHAERPFHLLLQGGDQLYADPIWHEVPALAAWQRLPWRQRRKTPFPPEMAEAVGNAYFDLYWSLWSQPQLAPVLATIPSLMMWDDHDIFDGWGSWAASWQQCPTFQGIWRAAREHFALFQLAAHPDDLPDGCSDRRGGQFGWAHRIGDVGIVAPDLRSERSRDRVLGDAGWAGLTAALERMADCRHVLLLSSMPLVTCDLRPLERFFDLLPGHQTWQDDLVDQWPSRAHGAEWTRLLRQLVGFSAATGACVTSLSGEIHLGALGMIEGRGTRIYQLTSSGIVHPAPKEWAVNILERIGARSPPLAPDLTVRLLPIPGLGRRFLRARNWLELELSPADGLTATWHSERPGEAPGAHRLVIAPDKAAAVQRPELIGTPARRSS
jgi:PhoD related phosphatase